MSPQCVFSGETTTARTAVTPRNAAKKSVEIYVLGCNVACQILFELESQSTVTPIALVRTSVTFLVSPIIVSTNTSILMFEPIQTLTYTHDSAEKLGLRGKISTRASQSLEWYCLSVTLAVYIVR